MQQIHYNIEFIPRNLRVPNHYQPQPLPSYNNLCISLILNRLYVTDDDDDYVQHDDSIEVASFEFMPNEVIIPESAASQILASMGVPLYDQPRIAFEIISYAQSMINGNQNYSNACLTVLILMRIMSSDDIGMVDEAEGRVMEESMGMFRPVPATRRAIEALEKTRLLDGWKMTEQCMVCLEELNSTVEVTRMPCSHIYHGDCIVRWLETSHMCPVCRFEMPT